MSLLKSIITAVLSLSAVFAFDMVSVVYAASADGAASTKPYFTDEMIEEALGHDSDANGIRDDVEEQISTLYKTRPHIRQHAMDYAYFIQQQIEYVNDRKKMLQVYTNSQTNLNCLRNAIANPVREEKIHAGLDDLIFNTQLRSHIAIRLKEHITNYSNVDVPTSYECVNGELLN